MGGSGSASEARGRGCARAGGARSRLAGLESKRIFANRPGDCAQAAQQRLGRNLAQLPAPRAGAGGGPEASARAGRGSLGGGGPGLAGRAARSSARRRGESPALLARCRWSRLARQGESRRQSAAARGFAEGGAKARLELSAGEASKLRLEGAAPRLRGLAGRLAQPRRPRLARAARRAGRQAPQPAWPGRRRAPGRAGLALPRAVTAEAPPLGDPRARGRGAARGRAASRRRARSQVAAGRKAERFRPAERGPAEPPREGGVARRGGGRGAAALLVARAAVELLFRRAHRGAAQQSLARGDELCPSSGAPCEQGPQACLAPWATSSRPAPPCQPAAHSGPARRQPAG